MSALMFKESDTLVKSWLHLICSPMFLYGGKQDTWQYLEVFLVITTWRMLLAYSRYRAGTLLSFL